MDRTTIGLIGVCVALVLIFLRVPIGVVMGIVGVAGIAAITSSNAAFGIAKTIPFELIGDWNLSAVPMFLLMGYVASATREHPRLLKTVVSLDLLFCGHVRTLSMNKLHPNGLQAVVQSLKKRCTFRGSCIQLHAVSLSVPGWLCKISKKLHYLQPAKLLHRARPVVSSPKNVRQNLHPMNANAARCLHRRT